MASPATESLAAQVIHLAGSVRFPFAQQRLAGQRGKRLWRVCGHDDTFL
ncbi:MAG TPA: hypothetical protein VE338_03335 [Ktedonobacterales bacterium]|nr:hypothetical protein [Ktedonobacterales bacterium]